MEDFSRCGADLLADVLPPTYRWLSQTSEDTTRAFLRLIDAWNTTEVWRPFRFAGAYCQVSSFGNLRGARKRCQLMNTSLRRDGTRRVEYRNYINGTMCTVYKAVLDAFWPNPNPTYYTSCDHIDRDTLNDRLSNLRWSTSQLNGLNKGATAVERLRSGRWRASVRLYLKRIGLGTYDTREEAVRVYHAAVERAFEILEVY
jgi:hypothetical protein